MIGYVTLGTNDLERAASFYDSLLAVIGANRMMDEDSFVAWATTQDAPSVAVSKPFNGEPATVGNGVMVALQAESEEAVKAIYEKAIELDHPLPVTI